MYATTNRSYNERGSKTNYVRSRILHCTLTVRAQSRTFRESYCLMCVLFFRYFSQIHVLPQKFTSPLQQLYDPLSANHPKSLRFVCHIIKHSARTHTLRKKNGTKRLSLMFHANKLFLVQFQNKGLVTHLYSHLPRLALPAGCAK